MFGFLVYLITLFFIFLSAIKINQHSKTKQYWSYACIGILPFVLVEGFRYMVGLDWLHYQEVYEYIAKGGDWYQQDLIFILTGIIFGKYCGFPCWSLFVILAIAYIYPIYFYANKNRKIALFLIPLYVLMNFCDAEVISRQYAALGFTYIAMYYLDNKENVKFLLYMLIGGIFHSTIIIFIPIYWLFHSRFFHFNCKKIYIILFIGAILIKDIYSIFPELNFWLVAGSTLIGKGQYAANSEEFLYGDQFVLGTMNPIYRFFFYLITLIIIIQGDKLIRKNNNLYFYYHISCLGLILYPLFYQQELIKRMILYFIIFSPVILAYIFRKEFLDSKGLSMRSAIYILIPIYFSYTILATGIVNDFQFYFFK